MTEARLEAEAAERANIIAALDDIAPHVFGNPFIPHTPLPAQLLGLGMHKQTQAADKDEVYELLYGGAAGGGKSDWLLMAAAQFVHKPEFAGVLIRRTYKQLAQPGAIMDRAHKWWNKTNGVHWNGTDKIFTFPSGAKVKMAFHGTPADDENFQGAEYQLAGYDELTHWPDASAYEWISLSRLRRPSGSDIPLRSLAASNPGGRGHSWVKKRFVGGRDLVTGELVKAKHDYIPARIVDNPYLDRRSYIKSLMRLHPTVREQLLNGDWSARDPGDYFRAEWFGELLDPVENAWPKCDKLVVRWWDLAASEAVDACHTAGVRMAKHRSGVRAIEHCRSFKRTPGARDDLIVQTAKADGRHVVVGIEIEPGSGGVAQFDALRRRLNSHGFKVAGKRPTAAGGDETDRERVVMVRAASSDSAKAARCDPVASCLERGYQMRGECQREPRGDWWGLDVGRDHRAQRDGIRLYAGEWTQDYLDVVEGFPGEGRMDEADATSGAWEYLESHPFGLAVPVAPRVEVIPAGEMHNLHPAERPDFVSAGRDRAGHWRP